MADEPNQGATEPTVEQAEPLGESPLSVQGEEQSAFDKRPEAFVGGAFAGGIVLALILRRLGP